MPDLTQLLTAIRASPDDGARWLDLAAYYQDVGRDDESDAVRVFWPALRDGLEDGSSLDFALEHVRRHAGRLGRRAREFEQQVVSYWESRDTPDPH